MADNISGKTMWCQMFSEPGAGSDVASLQSKCELDGDEWILNGQKVWTTLAHKSDYGIVVARTDPELVKHAGISMFILDMKAPGMEIRPIHQIDGGSHFNEVFFTDVRIPKDHLLGEYNAGWKLATAMLMYERVAIGSAGAGKINQPTYKLLRKAAEESGKINDPVVRDQLMQIYSMETTKAMVAMRNRAEQKAGKTPGPGGSLGKLFGSNIAWKMREFALEIAGPSSIAWDPDDATATSVSASCSTRSSRRSPAAPTRSSATSSATACSACPANRRRQGRAVQGPQGRHPDRLTSGGAPARRAPNRFRTLATPPRRDRRPHDRHRSHRPTQRRRGGRVPAAMHRLHGVASRHRPVRRPSSSHVSSTPTPPRQVSAWASRCHGVRRGRTDPRPRQDLA